MMHRQTKIKHIFISVFMCKQYIFIIRFLHIYVHICTYMYTQLIQTCIHIGTHTHIHFCFNARQTLVGLGLLTSQVSRLYSDTPRSVGLLWTNDRPVAETCTLQHSQETDIHASGGIRTRNPGKGKAIGIGTYVYKVHKNT